MYPRLAGWTYRSALASLWVELDKITRIHAPEGRSERDIEVAACVLMLSAYYSHEDLIVARYAVRTEHNSSVRPICQCHEDSVFTDLGSMFTTASRLQFGKFMNKACEAQYTQISGPKYKSLSQFIQEIETRLTKLILSAPSVHATTGAVLQRGAFAVSSERLAGSASTTC